MAGTEGSGRAALRAVWMMKNPETQARHVIQRACVSGFFIIHDVGPQAGACPLSS
jgi:hypothetical protein